MIQDATGSRWKGHHPGLVSPDIFVVIVACWFPFFFQIQTDGTLQLPLLFKFFLLPPQLAQFHYLHPLQHLLEDLQEDSQAKWAVGGSCDVYTAVQGDP